MSRKLIRKLALTLKSSPTISRKLAIKLIRKGVPTSAPKLIKQGWGLITIGRLELIRTGKGLKPLVHQVIRYPNYPFLCYIFSGVCFSLYVVVGATVGSTTEITHSLPTTPLVLAQGQLFNPKFAGFDMQPRGCDVQRINGWFYWYRHDLNRCTVVPAGNQADATFKALELADSTEVTEAGIGYRLIGDPIL